MCGGAWFGSLPAIAFVRSSRLLYAHAPHTHTSVYSESFAKVFAGLERHYMHYNSKVYQWAFRALEKLLPRSYTAAYLTVPRSPLDATWKLLATSLSDRHSVYLAALGAYGPAL